ncbi:MAG: hypothetical protein HY296_01620 [Thaumarchaeota archaeon]|nr:hypothetical protein [Nitrososphaerota archaeon]
MPELWIPYGNVETLVTLQAENLGTVVQAEAQPRNDSVDLPELARRASAVFVCDTRPATVEVLMELSRSISAAETLKVFASVPRKVEAASPDLRGRVRTLGPPIPIDGGVAFADELNEPGEKLFIGTAAPDPLYGISDTRVEACHNWVAGSKAEAARARKETEPTPFEKTESYKVMQDLAAKVRDARYFSVVPRGGKAAAVLDGPPFDVMRRGFQRTKVSPGRAIIVGAGGKGYDDTLSGALRSVWGTLQGVRKSGQVLLAAECSEGLGSTALEMLATGRLVSEGKQKRAYVDGLEEVFYLGKLKEDYEVLLLSGLPETYAKGSLALTTARGSGEAVGRLLNKIGRTSKVNVVPRAPEARVESG